MSGAVHDLAPLIDAVHGRGGIAGLAAVGVGVGVTDGDGGDDAVGAVVVATDDGVGGGLLVQPTRSTVAAVRTTPGTTA